MAIFGHSDIEVGEWSDKDIIFGSYYTCPEVGVLSKVSVYIGNDVVVGNLLKVAVYKKSDNSLVVESGAQQAVGTSWNDVALVADLAAEDYWLCVKTSWEQWNHLRFLDLSDADKAFYFEDAFANAFPNPINPDFHARQDHAMCIYATYTPSSSVSGSGGGGLHHGGDKRYKDARVINGWKLRS